MFFLVKIMAGSYHTGFIEVMALVMLEFIKSI